MMAVLLRERTCISTLAGLFILLHATIAASAAAQDSPAPGVIYGYGNTDVGGSHFGTLLRATVRTINHSGHGGDLHLQLQHGLMRRTVVEVGVGFHLQVWRRD